MSKVSPARKAAFDVLRAIEVEGAMSSMLAEYDGRLSPKDRGLCHEIVLGVLRRQIALDREIDHFANGKKLDLAIRVILRIGLYQLRHLDRVPAYSAINESVELAKMAKRRSAAGFVNAVLRRATRETPQFDFIDDIDRISFETSHPSWLLERWISSFGGERMASLANANNELPRHFFRPIRNATIEEVAQLEQYRDSRFDHVYSASTLDDLLRDLLTRRAIYLQDAGSQLVAIAVSNLIRSSFLDVCASPGGKTGLIAMLLESRPDVQITAGDVSRKRIDILRENLSAQGCSTVEIYQYDAEIAIPFEVQSFDTVFVDAPCSGTGTIRHNPEIRYRATDAEIERHSARQLRILTNASNLVCSGGSLVYSTCSLEVAENEGVADEFVRENGEFEICEIELDDRFREGTGYYRIWPDHEGCDGFFVASFRRSEK